MQGYEGYEISNLGNVRGPSGMLTPMKYVRVRVKGKQLSIHRLVYEAFGDEPIDTNMVIHHRDENTTNNRIDNLEQVTHRRNNNLKNRKRSSQYAGVHFRRSTGKYVAQISINGKKIYLGQYDTEEEAHYMYLQKLYEHKKI